MENNPFFSVVIAVYNTEDYIIETLESVSNQTFSDYEVIIIDDASTDSTYNLIMEYIENKESFKLYRNTKNIGCALSRNVGFKNARGEYIALLDADDLWLSQKLEMQYDLIEKSDVDISYTSYELIDKFSNTLNRIYRTKENLSYESLLKENYIGCSSAVFRKRISEKIVMDPNYSHEDFAFWLECIRNDYNGKGLMDPLMKYRILDGSRSYNKRRALLNRFKILYFKENINMLSTLYFLAVYSIRGFMKYWRINNGAK